MKRRLTFAAFIVTTLFGLDGCAHKPPMVKPQADVDSQLAPGEWGLRKLPPSEYPNMANAFMNRQGLMRALDRSIKYMEAPSSRQFFPSGPITHAQELASLEDLKNMFETIQSPEVFQQQILHRYDVYTSKGYDNNGTVWFTGYYTPIFHGSLTETAQYRYPIYSRPADLVSNPVTGAILGQRLPSGAIRPYPTRRQIVQGNLLAGHELAWFKTPLEAFIIQIQGSAKIRLTNGQTMMVGYAGKNGRSYHGVGAALVANHKLTKKQLSMPALINYFRMHPNQQNAYIMKDRSFEFLEPYPAAIWPAGSLGFKVTPFRTLATDKSIFPRAAMTFVSTDMPNASGVKMPTQSFLLDQDTGGAIRAAGRADIYMGIGPQAGALAGREYDKGRLYYLFLKPRFMGPYEQPGNGQPGAAAYGQPGGAGAYGPGPKQNMGQGVNANPGQGTYQPQPNSGAAPGTYPNTPPANGGTYQAAPPPPETGTWAPTQQNGGAGSGGGSGGQSTSNAPPVSTGQPSFK